MRDTVTIGRRDWELLKDACTKVAALASKTNLDVLDRLDMVDPETWCTVIERLMADGHYTDGSEKCER